MIVSIYLYWQRVLYTFLLAMLAPIYFFGRLLWSSGYGHGLTQRFGFINIADKYRGAIWIHAVSVGETVAAMPLIDSLRERFPTVPLVLSTTTLTGAEKIRELYPDIPQFFFPWDFMHVACRALQRIEPRILLLLETELWPNIVRASNSRNIPILLFNARLSERSAKRYQWAQPLVQSTLNNLSKVGTQTSLHAERFKALGLSPERLQVCGNLKFDIKPSQGQQEDIKTLRSHCAGRLVWVVGSTHAGEEEQILMAAQSLAERFTNLLVILAPRHPQRFSSVWNMCAAQAMAAQKYSVSKIPKADTQILLLDVMGLLPTYLGVADIAFIGGSLVPTGGHNMFEATVHGVPVLCGPHLFNFESLAQILQEVGALSIVDNTEAIVKQFSYWVNDNHAYQQAQQGAQRAVTRLGGATARYINLAEAYLA